MNCKSGNLILKVYKLGLAGLIIIGDRGLVKLKAHTLEVCNCSVNKVSLNTDVTALAGALAHHKLKGIARKVRLGGLLNRHTEEKIEELMEYAREHGEFSFRALLLSQASKMQIIVMFLAILEMMKIGKITITQEDIFDDIIISYIEG